MNLLQEHNKKYQFFHDITGVAMKVYNKYRPGLLESAYEAALKYLLEIASLSFGMTCNLTKPIVWTFLSTIILYWN